jgi:pterin-4a-carbinolamine dehydratase
MKTVTTKKDVSTKKPVVARAHSRRLKALATVYTIAEPAYKLTATISFASYLEAFMCMCRIVVHAEVLGEAPELTLKNASLKIIIGDGKHSLSEGELSLAEHTLRILSTVHPTK